MTKEELEIFIKKVSELACPYSNGFEGPETFLPCRKDACPVCLARKLVDE